MVELGLNARSFFLMSLCSISSLPMQINLKKGKSLTWEDKLSSFSFFASPSDFHGESLLLFVNRLPYIFIGPGYVFSRLKKLNVFFNQYWQFLSEIISFARMSPSSFPYHTHTCSFYFYGYFLPSSLFPNSLMSKFNIAHGIIISGGFFWCGYLC